MSAKFTPGPWREHSHRQIGPVGGVVCEVWSSVGGKDAISQADANCLLISAAPDMFEALNRIANGGGVPGPVKAIARAAIAKATGDQS